MIAIIRVSTRRSMSHDSDPRNDYDDDDDDDDFSDTAKPYLLFFSRHCAIADFFHSVNDNQFMVMSSLLTK